MKNVIAYLLLFNLLIAPAFADSQTISKQEAISIAQQSHPGRVLSVKQKNGHYRIKIIDDKGNVRMVTVDASRESAKKD